ncbi:MAG: hypothetical protein S4CHLAM20_14750 [Chlamydiia bacterium]|nr:hypothetical protein [Chlamydiia bacterium]
MPKDECYYQALESHGGRWSARAAQQTAKCRKKKGIVRKTKQGSNLKRWAKEEWTDEDGRPCGSSPSSNKKRVVKCRPSKRVSNKTPVTWRQLTPSQKKRAVTEKKKVGMGRKASPIRKSSPTTSRSPRGAFHLSPSQTSKKSDTLTLSQKKKFLADPEINPLTGRKIKIDGPTYNKLMKMCSSYRGKSPRIKRISPRGSLENKPLYKPFPAKDGKHKYSVYVKSESGGRKLIHFGQAGAEHYHDKIGKLSYLNHGDPKRRKSYRARHNGEQYDKDKAGWWAWHKLW